MDEVQVSANLLNSQLVDPKTFLVSRAWLPYFQKSGLAITQTTVNQTVISEDKSATSFDSVGPALDVQAALSSVIPTELWSSLAGDRQESLSYEAHQQVAQEPALEWAVHPATATPLDIDWSSPAVAPNWTPFTSTVTPSGGITYTITSQECRYAKAGDTVSYRMDIVGTLGAGVGSSSISLQAPAPPRGLQSAHGHAIIGSGNKAIFGTISGSTIVIEYNDNTAFQAGALRIILTGVYQSL